MKRLFFAVLFLLFLGFSCAQEFYADVEIEISEAGEAVISGTSNHPALTEGATHEFTSKEGKKWMFSLSPEGVFSDYIFSVKLPENVSINYINAPSSVNISGESGRIVVSGVGRDESLELKIQYSIAENEPEKTWLAGLEFYAVLIAGLAVLFGLFFFLRKKPEKIGVALTERQEEIVGVVRKNKGSVSQKVVEKELGIPKSSVSRNVDTLVKKGVLRKEQKGSTNILFLEKQE